MARKITVIVTSLALVLCALCAPISAATYNVYTEGNMNTTYVQYFKDILAGAKITDDYVAFRSGQYEYTMAVGKLGIVDGGIIASSGECKVYRIGQEGTYNARYTYSTETTTGFSVDPNDSIVYSNLGDYPQLIERSAHIETLSLIALGGICVFVLVDRIFRHS